MAWEQQPKKSTGHYQGYPHHKSRMSAWSATLLTYLSEEQHFREIKPAITTTTIINNKHFQLSISLRCHVSSNPAIIPFLINSTTEKHCLLSSTWERESHHCHHQQSLQLIISMLHHVNPNLSVSLFLIRTSAHYRKADPTTKCIVSALQPQENKYEQERTLPTFLPSFKSILEDLSRWVDSSLTIGLQSYNLWQKKKGRKWHHMIAGLIGTYCYTDETG